MLPRETRALSLPAFNSWHILHICCLQTVFYSASSQRSRGEPAEGALAEAEGLFPAELGVLPSLNVPGDARPPLGGVGREGLSPFWDPFLMDGIVPFPWINSQGLTGQDLKLKACTNERHRE